MASRTPHEVRDSIERNRAELAVSLENLRGEVARLTDWRARLVEHQQKVLVGAAVAGFVLGGGVAAIGSIVFRRRGRR